MGEGLNEALNPAIRVRRLLQVRMPEDAQPSLRPGRRDQRRGRGPSAAGHEPVVLARSRGAEPPVAARPCREVVSVLYAWVQALAAGSRRVQVGLRAGAG